MEKQERVLAYRLAKTIEYDELSEVSGGGAPGRLGKGTFVLTGGHGVDVDGKFDFDVGA